MKCHPCSSQDHGADGATDSASFFWSRLFILFFRNYLKLIGINIGREERSAPCGPETFQYQYEKQDSVSDTSSNSALKSLHGKSTTHNEPRRTVKRNVTRSLQPVGNNSSRSCEPSLDDISDPRRSKRRRTIPPEDRQLASDSLIESPMQHNESFATSEGTPERTALDGNSRLEQLGHIASKPEPKIADGKFSSPCQSPPKHEDLSGTVSEAEDTATKVLKLNPNGKLLSSPVIRRESNRSTSHAQKRKPYHQRKKRGDEVLQPQILVLKYGSNNDARLSVGRAIDEILGGFKRYDTLRESASSRKPSRSPLRKPTHPFFLNCGFPNALSTNPALQGQLGPHAADGLGSSATSIQDTRKTNELNDCCRKKLSDTDKSSFSVFSRTPKLPEPIEPIWPPRDTVHVRETEAHTHDAVDSHKNIDSMCGKKKAKGSAPNVSESESILSIEAKYLSSSRHDNSRSTSTLRRPQRQVYGYQELHDLIKRGLSCMNGLKEVASHEHPAIKSLLSLVLSSKNAFNDASQAEDFLWANRYTPISADQVLQSGPEAFILREWLQKLVIRNVDKGNSAKDGSKPKQLNKDEKKRRKRRRKAKGLDDFIVDSNEEEPYMNEVIDPDEDELSGSQTISQRRTIIRSNIDTSVGSTENRSTANSVLISGPSGCGKSAAVYAVAKELGFEIFEINAGSRRSAKDIVERVGDMTQNHLVQLLGQINGETPGTQEDPNAKSDTGKQQKMGSFFTKNSTSSTSGQQGFTVTEAANQKEKDSRPQASQKQSVILLEEVDVLFDEDRFFWNGVLALINQSKRPVIMTCNDESLLPLNDLRFHAILRFRRPPCDLVADYVQLICANEGHIIEHQAICDLYRVLRCDMRATIMQLDFWCQMAVGSKKSGLDWIVLQRQSAQESKVISNGTYIRGMDWYNQDTATEECNYLKRNSQVMMECMFQWNIGSMEWEETTMRRRGMPATVKSLGQLNALQSLSDAADARSSLDIMSSFGSVSSTDISKVF